MEISITKADGTKEPYELRVAIVHERDENGVPRKIELIRPDESVDVTKHNEFLTVFVAKAGMEPAN